MTDNYNQNSGTSGGVTDDSVYTAAIQDLAVTRVKIADAAINATKVANDIATQTELDNLTASDVGAIADSASSVTQTNLNFDPATQTELNGLTYADVGAIQDAGDAVLLSHIDDGGVVSGQVIEHDGTGWTVQNKNALADNVVYNNTVQLSSSSTTVSTGVTTTPAFFSLYLDPSGNGQNTADVKVSARSFWDNSVGEYKVEVLEDGTSVGNPYVGLKVIQY